MRSSLFHTAAVVQSGEWLEIFLLCDATFVAYFDAAIFATGFTGKQSFAKQLQVEIDDEHDNGEMPVFPKNLGAFKVALPMQSAIMLA